MKRFIMLTVLSSMAAFLVLPLAVGQAGTRTTTTFSSVSPKRDASGPYIFTTRGRIKYTRKVCSANAPKRTCIPLRCAPGARNAAYCTRRTKAQLCRRGRIRVTIKSGTRIRSFKTVRLNRNCRYVSRSRIKTTGILKVSVRYLGSSILKASRASTKTVRAG